MWATKTVLAPGSKQLATAISNATAGDTIVFQTGTYTENGSTITLQKKITFMAEEDAKPQVSLYCFRMEAEFEAIGIEFSNCSSDNYLFRTGANIAGTIAFKNCTLSNKAPTSFLYLSSNNVGSLEIDNCVFTGTTKNQGGLIYAGSTTGNLINNFTMTNSTAYNIAGELAVWLGNCTNALVDHCTFYNCGTRVVYLSGTLTSCVVKNCIVSAPEIADAYCIATYGGTVSNCLYYNYNAPRSGSGTGYAAVSDCINKDPLFKDAANANFDLKGGSPAINAATDGSNIGDPRWGVGARDPKIEVAPGTKTIKTAFETAQAGDTLILKTGTYSESSSITFDKKITIMAAKDAKPVVEINKWVIAADFEVNGLEITNMESDYMLRTGGNVNGTIAIKNCYMHNSPSAFVYLSSNTVTNLIIDNCVFADNTKTQGAVVYAQAATVTNFTMTNSTMYNCGTELTAWFEGLANAYVDHCTFYNCGTRVLYFKGSDTNALVSSSINNTVVSNPTLVNGEAVAPYTGTVSNFVYYNTSDGVNWQATPTKVVNADPQFVDAANGNFDFAIASPLFLAATDGKNIGDPRWNVELGETAIDLPATLNKANVTATAANMTYYETEYFDFGPNDSSNDTLLWAMWAVNVAKGKFSVVAEVTSTNDYKLQLEFIDPATSEVVMTVLGKTKNPDLGKVDLNGLVAGKYLLRLKNRTGWSAVKVKNLTFTQVGGKAVDMPATLVADEEHLMLSEYAVIDNDSILMADDGHSWLVAEGWAKWNIKVAEKAKYSFTANTCVNPGFSSNGWQFKLALINGMDTIYSKSTAKTWSNGDVANDMGSVVLEPGTYTLQMQNIMDYSKGRLLSVEVEKEYLALDIKETAENNNVLAEAVGNTYNVTLTRPLSAEAFNTICLPFALTAEQIAASDMASDSIYGLEKTTVEGDAVIFVFKKKESLEAGVPYIIRPTDAVESTVSFDAVKITTAVASSTETTDAYFRGTFVKKHLDNAKYLYLKADRKLYSVNSADDGYMSGLRAYFELKTAPGVAIRRAAIRLGSDMVTSLDLIDGQAIPNGKFMFNGQIVIRVNGQDYMLNGMQK